MGSRVVQLLVWQRLCSRRWLYLSASIVSASTGQVLRSGSGYPQIDALAAFSGIPSANFHEGLNFTRFGRPLTEIGPSWCARIPHLSMKNRLTNQPGTSPSPSPNWSYQAFASGFAPYRTRARALSPPANSQQRPSH